MKKDGFNFLREEKKELEKKVKQYQKWIKALLDEYCKARTAKYNRGQIINNDIEKARIMIRHYEKMIEEYELMINECTEVK